MDNPNPATWFGDELKTAAIWVVNPENVPVEASGRGKGFELVTSKSITYMSCYLTPSGSIQDYYMKLEDIEDLAREAGSNIIVAAELNYRFTPNPHEAPAHY